ncbi:hypothetical protein VD0002_g9944 [Verticillium dahliae]|nr:hypothetical protein VD0002_g9944 [Verticillium dahliae]
MALAQSVTAKSSHRCAAAYPPHAPQLTNPWKSQPKPPRHIAPPPATNPPPAPQPQTRNKLGPLSTEIPHRTRPAAVPTLLTRTTCLKVASTMLDKLVGLAMLVAASVIFTYYTIWTLLIPFVDDDHPLQSLFPARVWAIRIPVILILLASAVVGSFLGTVMIRSNKKKAAKAKAAAKKKA